VSADATKAASFLPLELDGTQATTLAAGALARIVAHLESLPRQRAADVDGAAEVAHELIERTAPEEGASGSELFDLLFDRAVPKSFNTAGPGYLAYIPGGGLFSSAVAALIADAVNRYVGVYAAAPALTQLETNVVRWFARIAGLPAGAGGVLTTGGSLAGFSAVVAARHTLGETFHDGVLYASDEVHHSVAKAAALAGFPARAVRTVPTDAQFRIRIDALTAAIAEDRSRGLRPCMLVGNAGSTNTGAVDDLAALAELAARERLWFHVDAAYGGFFLLTERGRATLAGIEHADSIALDPHKGLFLPYGLGCLLVRDVETLRRSHGSGGDYLPDMQADPDDVDFCEISPELSRGFRGLRVWLPIKLHGLRAFRQALDEKLDLAAWTNEQLAALPEIEILTPPQLSLVAFRHRAPGKSPAERDAFNRRLLAEVNARQRVHLSGATIRGAFALRICVLSFRTHRDRVQAAIEDLEAAIAAAT